MFAKSGKARLAYDVTGNAGPTDVLLLHAGVTDRRSWSSVIDELAPNHRCVAFDMRSYGETEYEPEDGWSSVEDAVAVLDAAGVDKVAVVACSMGGQAGIDLTLAHPDRVSALVLIGSAVRGAPYPDDEDEELLKLYARLEAAEEAGDLDEVNRFEAWVWLDGPTSLEGRVSGPARDLFLEMNAIALHAPDVGKPAEIEPAWPRVDTIAVPTLVLIGKLDVPDIQAVDEQLAATIPGARLVWLDDAAHLPQLEAHPVCIAEIKAFVGELA